LYDDRSQKFQMSEPDVRQILTRHILSTSSAGCSVMGGTITFSSNKAGTCIFERIRKAERPGAEAPAACDRRHRGCSHVGRCLCDSNARLLTSREISLVVESDADWCARMPFRCCFVPL